MKFEFIYLVLAVVGSVVYYYLQKKFVFKKRAHSQTLIKGMRVNLVFSIACLAVSLFTLLITDGIAYGLEIKYGVDLFRFLLRTPNISSRAMLLLNVAVAFFSATTAFVAGRISQKRKGHKNLSLEKILTSNAVVCFVCTGLSIVELMFCFLSYA